jgi:hypothetical protein
VYRWDKCDVNHSSFGQILFISKFRNIDGVIFLEIKKIADYKSDKKQSNTYEMKEWMGI